MAFGPYTVHLGVNCPKSKWSLRTVYINLGSLQYVDPLWVNITYFTIHILVNVKPQKNYERLHRPMR